MSKSPQFDIDLTKYKKDIIKFIVTTLGALIIGKIADPLAANLYSLFLEITGGTMAFITNSTYRQISQGFSEQTSLFTLYLVYMFSIILLTFAFSKVQEIYDSSNKEYELMKQGLDAVQEFDKIKSLDSQKVDDTVAMEVAASSEGQTSIKDPSELYKLIISGQKRLQQMSLFINTTLVVCFIILFALFSQHSFIRAKVIALTNNIEIVSPYISDLEYKHLKSQFHSISNASDYENLITRLTEIADQNNLSLKK